MCSYIGGYLFVFKSNDKELYSLKKLFIRGIYSVRGNGKNSE